MKQDNYNFDQKITDRGWQAMRQSLDRELPEKRKRRGFVWWWTTAAALLLAGGFWYFRTHLTAPADTQAPATPVAVRPPAIEKNTAPVHPPAPQEDRLLKIIEPAIAAPRKSPGRSRPDLTRFDPAETPRADLQNQKSGVQMPDFVLSLPSTPQPDTAQTIATTAAGSPTTPIASLPGRQANPVYLADLPPLQTFDLPAIQPAGKTSPKTWNWGASASLLSGSSLGFSGVGTGFVVDWQPLRRFGLRTGIGYRYKQTTPDARSAVTLTPASYFGATQDSLFILLEDMNDNLGASPLSSNVPTVLLPIHREHLLEMPVLAYWEPLRHFRLSGGVYLSQLMIAQTGTETYSFTQDKILYNSSKTVIQNLNKAATRAAQNLEVQWSAGIGYRVGKHWEFDLHYRAGKAEQTAVATAKNATPTNSMVDPLNLTYRTGRSQSSLFQLTVTRFFR